MPSKAMKKKDLYLGKCMEDLHKLSEIKNLGNNVNIIIRSADKVFKDAQLFDGQGDEERSFVMYMKYFNIIQQIKVKPDYKKQKEFFDNLIGKKNQLTAIERAETLSDDLKERYDFKKAEAVASKLAAINTEKQIKDNKSFEKEKKDVDVQDTKKNGSKPEKEENIAPKSISCGDLCQLLRDSSVQLILMDVRSSEDFAQSHISHTDCISVPQDIVVPGSTVNRIQSSLPQLSKEVWVKRKNADHIILFDWNSRLETATLGTPLNTLKDALYKFDTSTVIKSEPLILDGGYEQWLLYYPTMTTNAHVIRPSDLYKQDGLSPTSILDFDYPELDENLQKVLPPKPILQEQPQRPEHIAFSSAGGLHMPASPTTAPKFDRTLKPAHLGETSLNNTLPRSPDSSTNLAELTSGKTMNNISTSSGLYPSVLKSSDMKINPKNINVINDISKNGAKMSNIDSELKESVRERGKREAELRDFQERKDQTQRQDDQRVKEAEEKLRNLEEMRKKEQKDVADLMRMKKKLMEDVDAEKRRQEEDLQQLQAEEIRRTQELEKAKQEEDEKRQRMKEVERMREDRKRGEQQKEQEVEQIRQQEVTRQAKEEEERQAENQRKALDEEKLLERLKLEEEEKKAEVVRQEELKKQREAEAVKLQSEREAAEQLKRENERLLREKQEREKKEMEEKLLKEQEKKRKEQEETKQREQQRLRLELEERKKEEERKKADERERQEKAKSAGTTTTGSKTVPSNSMPSGWEKRLDFATNRYFYIDHNRGETHWTPPAMMGEPKAPNTYVQKLKDEPSVSSSRGLSRSHSSPNIMKELADEERARKALPGVDRGSKPVISKPEQPNNQIVYQKRPPDLDPIYGNVGPALTGLRNLGNTCYMNSTIQCLNNTSPLVTYILNDLHLRDINRESSQGMHGEVVDDFAAVIKALWSQQYRSIKPKDLKSTVGKYNPMFAGYKQQDSQEFLTFLLDGLHEGLNEVHKPPKIPEQNNDNMPAIEAADLAWKHHRMLHRSIIVELFQGQLKSTLMCRYCKKTSTTYQAFMFLSLPIPASSQCSLKDCLREFLKPEMMTGSSKWKCPRCKVERDAEKKIDIWKLPHILLIGLNRFYGQGMWMEKKTTFVNFPTQGLDLSDTVLGPTPRKAFNLFGVSNHYGTMEGGHYTAFCRNPVNKKWHKFDDQDVYEISQSDVKSSAAFVLYYSSIEMQAPTYRALSS